MIVPASIPSNDSLKGDPHCHGLSLPKNSKQSEQKNLEEWIFERKRNSLESLKMLLVHGLARVGKFRSKIEWKCGNEIRKRRIELLEAASTC